MHKGIEKVSQKTPLNQGVGFALGRTEGVQADATLFERFSEILEKIASSLSTQQQGEELPDPAQFVAHFEAPPQVPVVDCRVAPKERAPEKTKAVEVGDQQEEQSAQTTETSVEEENDHPGRALGHENQRRIDAHERRDERAELRAEQKDARKSDGEQSPAEEQAPQATDQQPVEAVAQVELPIETAPQAETIPVDTVVEQFVQNDELSEQTTDAPTGEVVAVPVEGEVVQAAESQTQAVENTEVAAPVEGEEAVPVTAEAAVPVQVDAQAPVQPELQTTANVPVQQNAKAAPAEQQAAAPETETPGTEQQLTTAESLQMRTLTVNEKAAQSSKKSEINTRSENQALLARAMESLLSQNANSPANRQLTDAAVSRSSTALKGAQPLPAQSSATGIIGGKRDARPESKGGSDLKGMPRAQSLRTLERVESALREVARSKDGRTISLRLDPPELGTVKIDVTIRDNNLHARISAETAQVSALLRERSSEIQAALRKLGFDLEKITVSVNSSLTADIGDDTSKRSKNFTEEMSNFAQSKNGTGEAAQGNRGAAGDAQAAVTDHWVA